MPFHSNSPPGLYRRLQYANYVKRYINRNSNRNFQQTPYEPYDLPPLIHDHDHDHYMENYNELFFKSVYYNTKVKINNDQNMFCPICQSDVKINTEIIRELKCKHTFHLECIDKWFLSKSECPLCKKNLDH